MPDEVVKLLSSNLDCRLASDWIDSFILEDESNRCNLFLNTQKIHGVIKSAGGINQ